MSGPATPTRVACSGSTTAEPTALPSFAVRGRAQARLRTAALLGIGALAVHELRYRIAFGDDSQSALASSGHGYLGLVAPALALLAMIGLASLVQRIASGDAPARARRGGIWLTLTAGLLAIFCVQELLESLFATGRPDGLHGVFGDGGWLAIPLSMAVAAVALAFVRVAGANTFRGVATAFITLRPLDLVVPGRTLDAPRRRSPLLRHLAGRGPPLPA
jgi:hypothetical protein